MKDKNRHRAADGETALLETPEHIAGSILLVRGRKVLLHTDLARLYGVEPRVLVQAVKRNIERFPEDFMFQLTGREAEILKSQSVISSGWGGRRHAPYAFTEHGVAMLSSVLRSSRAIRVNIEIVRAFVRLRRTLAEHADLAVRLSELEGRCDERFQTVFDALASLTSTEPPPQRRIGFTPDRA